MKEINVSCDSLENFKIFYESLYTHGKNYNVHIRSHDNTDPSHLSEPNFNNNVKDCMRSYIHSILSKDNIFHHNFKEGRIALKMTTNGHNVLDTLLGKTHSKLQCKWSCERAIPKYSNYNDLSLCCSAMIECLDQERMSGRPHLPGE